MFSKIVVGTAAIVAAKIAASSEVCCVTNVHSPSQALRAAWGTPPSRNGRGAGGNDQSAFLDTPYALSDRWPTQTVLLGQLTFRRQLHARRPRIGNDEAYYFIRKLAGGAGQSRTSLSVVPYDSVTSSARSGRSSQSD